MLPTSLLSFIDGRRIPLFVVVILIACVGLFLIRRITNNRHLKLVIYSSVAILVIGLAILTMRGREQLYGAGFFILGISALAYSATCYAINKRERVANISRVLLGVVVFDYLTIMILSWIIWSV